MAEDPETAVVNGRTGRDASGAIREVVQTLLLALVMFLIARGLVQSFRVEGTSMEPTLHTNQFLLVNKVAYLHFDINAPARLFTGNRSLPPKVVYPFGKPAPGDIVVFEYPLDPSRDYIKRIIAVEGQRVAVRNGTVYVDGQPLHEPYIASRPAYTMPELLVPQGTVFVLGDNRNTSSDSHQWGVLPVENIIGKAWLSYWPPSAWGVVPSGMAQPIDPK
jgi:signal peptidase I